MEKFDVGDICAFDNGRFQLALCRITGYSRLSSFLQIKDLNSGGIYYVSPTNLKLCDPRDIVRWKLAQSVI